MKLVSSREVLRDNELSEKGINILIDNWGKELGVVEHQPIFGTKKDYEYSQDGILIMDTGVRYACSYRFRKYKYWKYKDVTFRNTRPSGINSDIAKMSVDFFIYGVLNKQETGFMWYIILRELQKLLHYIEKHPSIKEIRNNKDNSSDFIAIKVEKIPSFFIVKYYDNTKQHQTN